jgi:hypothetical protein
MMDFLQENWKVVLPLAIAVIGFFWPQLKPIIGPLINPKPGPVAPVVDPQPTPKPAVNPALQLAMLLLQAMLEANNKEGADLAREAAKTIIDQEEQESAK